MRTLILGAKGQLGRDLMQVFSSAGETAGYDLPEVDVADDSLLQPVFRDFAPDLVINAAAYTDVEGAEEHLQEAFLANETGARNVAELAEYHHIPVVYFSTDFVFDGTKETPYEPDDTLSPLSVYGRSKAAGEAATRKANPHHFILRTAWLYGPGGNHFVKKILAAARKHPSLRVVEDEVGCPTHTLDLARATMAMVRTRHFGTYHAVSTGSCSRYEFARDILQIAEIDTPVEPCPSTEYPSKAERPAHAVLSTDSLTTACGYEMPSWRKALLAYMQREENLS